MAVLTPGGLVTTTSPTTADDSFLLGGDLPVRRIGFGSMHLTGPGH
jgi:pyridoxine 4-dehydrogenase